MLRFAVQFDDPIWRQICMTCDKVLKHEQVDRRNRYSELLGGQRIALQESVQPPPMKLDRLFDGRL